MAHSQGALHAQRLISKYIQGTKLQRRMICAYAIGYIIPDNLYDELFPMIPKSQSSTDTNCLISWSTVVEGFKRERVRTCLLYTSPSPRDGLLSRMPSSA